MNKKILIILIIALAVFTVAGFFVFKYSKKIETTLENSVNTEAEEQYDEDSLPQQNETGEGENFILQNDESTQIEIKTAQDMGLFVCVDKCGDGVCQPSDPKCEDNLNCVCGETKEECPADCR